MPAIQFFEEDIAYKLKNKTAVRKWITDTIKAEGYSLQELTYIFCSDEYLLGINQQYLDHDTYTDIITFDNSEEEGKLEGDIYVSIDRVKENAETLGIDFEMELRRVLIHGLLHLVGFEDTDDNLKSEMRAKEDECLLLF